MNNMGSLVNWHTITYERLLPCSAERAWEWISSPDQVSKWRRCNSDFVIELVEGEGPAASSVLLPDCLPV